MVVVVILMMTIISIIGSSSAAQHGHAHSTHGYKYGDAVIMECVDYTGAWQGAPKCVEKDGKPMSFKYGVDEFQHCGWKIDSKQMMEWVKQLIQQQKSWNCRVKMSPEHEFYLPFSLPLWGVVEADHSHIDNHLNMIFHADQGRIIGAAAYPVRDRFAFAREGVVVNFHGPIKWWQGNSFQPLNRGAFKAGDAHRLEMPVDGAAIEILLWVTITLIFTVVASALVYKFRLKPQLLKKMIKKD